MSGVGNAAGVSATITYPGQPALIGFGPESLTFSQSGSGLNSLNQPFTWSVSGTGELATGTLKAKAQTNNAAETGIILNLNDRPFVKGAANTQTTALFELIVDGKSTIGTLCECFSGVSMVTYIRGDFGPQTIYQSSFDYAWNVNNIGLGGTEFYKHDPAGDVEIRTDAKGAWDFTLRIAVPFFVGPNGESNAMTLNQFLHIRASQSNGGSAGIDVSDTARLRVILEDGYSLGSESGLLLTAAPPASAVPEPSTMALGLVGLASLVVSRRLRRSDSA